MRISRAPRGTSVDGISHVNRCSSRYVTSRLSGSRSCMRINEAWEVGKTRLN